LPKSPGFASCDFRPS